MGFVILILILLHCNYCFCENEETRTNYDIIKVITDFFLMLNQPLRITTSTLCWKKDELFNLTKTLMHNGFLTTPSKGNLSTYWPHEQQMFVVDMACENSYETLASASNSDLTEYPFRWLIIQESNSTEMIPNLNAYIRSKIYILQKHDYGYKIISKYRLGKFSYEYQTNEIAAWSENEFKYFNRLIDARNRTNIMKETVNLTLVIFTPEDVQHLSDGREKHIIPTTKVNYPLVLHAIDFMNATPGLLIRYAWSSSNNSKVISMMDDAQLKTADVLVSSIFYVKARVPYIDAIASTTKSRLKFIFRAPPLSYVKNVYVLPFHFNVWLASIGVLFVSSIIFYIITSWEMHCDAFNYNEAAKNSVARLQPDVSDVLQIQIGAVCQQGSEAEPISGAGRIATIILFICMLFLYTSYSANIVALLQSTTDSIQGLDGLLYSRMSLGVQDNTYNRYFFTNMPGKSQQQQAIYIEKVAPPGKPDNFMDLYTGVRKMRDEFFAFHSECTTIYKVVSDIFQEHEKCGLMEIEYFNMNEPYLTIRKNTSYGEVVKAAFRKMAEGGIISREFNRIYMKKPPCANPGGKFLSVSLKDCYAAFLIFAIGVGIAVFVLIVEKIYYYGKYIL